MVEFIQQNTVLSIVAVIAVFGAGTAIITRNSMAKMAKIVDQEFIQREEMNPILKVIAKHSNDIQELKERQ
ncbi:hypothetical protein ACTOV4_02790 [Brucella sp. C7-11G]